LAEHFHVAVDIVLNDMATSRTLEPDVVPALRQFELPQARSSRARATKPKRLGAICRPVQSGRCWRRSRSHRFRGLGAVGLAALSAACRLSDLLGRNGSFSYALLLGQCHLDPFE
jgi:hypothetical protein